MAHAKGYKVDIFISYARKDNEPIGASAGWVEVFHNALETWLIKRRGLENLTIWRDTEDLRGNTDYEIAIENGLVDSALFFAMHSRNYVKSEYCQKELRWFHEANGNRPGGLRIGDRHRIFNVLLNNIHFDDWSPMLEGSSGFPMHNAKGLELGDFTFAEEPLYMRQLQQIVDSVEETLGLLDSFEAGAGAVQGTPKPQVSERIVVTERPRQGSAAPAPQAEAAQVFVADTSDSLYKRRERLLADLQGNGLTVYQDVPPPMESEAHAEKVQQIMKQSPLSVHLLDQWPGRRVMDDRATTYSIEQVKLGLESGARQLIWAPPDLDLKAIEDEEYRDFLTELEQGVRGERNYEFVRASMVDFAEMVCQKALQKASDAAGEAQIGGSILLDTHQKDQRYGFKVADLLADRGIEVQFNQESVDPVKSLDHFEEAIQHAKSLMIMCGQVAPEWLMGRVKKAVRVAAEQFDRDDGNILEDIWIYLLPGAGATPVLNRIPFRIEILDNSKRDTIEPEVMAPFFAAR